jgi:hypothetical protein
MFKNVTKWVKCVGHVPNGVLISWRITIFILFQNHRKQLRNFTGPPDRPPSIDMRGPEQ